MRTLSAPTSYPGFAAKMFLQADRHSTRPGEEKMQEDRRRFESESYLILDAVVQSLQKQGGGAAAKPPFGNKPGIDRDARTKPLSRDTILRLIETLKDR
jgi:hypothetical protein